MYSTGESDTTDDIIKTVNSFINMNTNETDFVGNFTFIGTWSEMHPYPAGASEEQAQPYLGNVSSSMFMSSVLEYMHYVQHI